MVLFLFPDTTTDEPEEKPDPPITDEELDDARNNKPKDGVSPEDEIPIWNETTREINTKVYIPGRFWPNGIVPYQLFLSGSMEGTVRSLVARGISEIEDNSCVK